MQLATRLPGVRFGGLMQEVGYNCNGVAAEPTCWGAVKAQYR